MLNLWFLSVIFFKRTLSQFIPRRNFDFKLLDQPNIFTTLTSSRGNTFRFGIQWNRITLVNITLKLGHSRHPEHQISGRWKFRNRDGQLRCSCVNMWHPSSTIFVLVSVLDNVVGYDLTSIVLLLPADSHITISVRTVSWKFRRSWIWWLSYNLNIKGFFRVCCDCIQNIYWGFVPYLKPREICLVISKIDILFILDKYYK